MPEFILDHGDDSGTRWLAALDSFTFGYVEALFFTSTGTGDDGDLEDASVAELSSEARAAIVADCERFQAANADALESASEHYPDSEGAGRDFLYTRNGHGVGFWDRSFLPPDLRDALSKAARRWGELNPYRGDDGALYLA